MHPQSTRTCESCKQILPCSAFAYKYVSRSNGSRHRNGLHRRCIECQAAAHKRINRPEYIIDPETGCWNWNRAFSTNGYGMARKKVNGRTMVAHRYVYIQHRGPIPDDMTLDHLCRNKACVNPDHLEPVPHIVNCQRSDKSILTEDDVRKIRAMRGVMPYWKIGRKFGVSYSAIACIMNGSRWWNVDDDGIA